MAAFAVLVLRDDPAFGQQRLPDRFAFLPAECIEELVLLDFGGQGAQPLAGGQVEEVAQQVAGAEPWVALILAQALDQVRQVRDSLLSGEIRRVGDAGCHVREQFHALADRGQLREGAQVKPLGRVLVPALERIAGDRVDHPVLRGEVPHRVGQELPHVTVVGTNGWETKRRLAGRWPARLIRRCVLHPARHRQGGCEGEDQAARG